MPMKASRENSTLIVCFLDDSTEYECAVLATGVAARSVRESYSLGGVLGTTLLALPDKYCTCFVTQE